MQAFDYVIVGAGAAGCLLAHSLCEDGRYTVCILEAGPSDINPYLHIPAGFIKVGHDPRYTWDFSTEPAEGSAGRRVVTRMGARWADQARSTASTTHAVSHKITISGRHWVMPDGATARCCLTSDGPSDVSASMIQQCVAAKGCCLSPIATGDIPCAMPLSRQRAVNWGFPRMQITTEVN